MAEEDRQQMVVRQPGIIALGENLLPEPSLEYLSEEECFIQVACGENHSMLVCEAGRVYAFGNHQDTGWMNFETDSTVEPRLVATLGAIKVTQVACGDRYTLFVSDKYEVHACGMNMYGQLGLGHTTVSPYPVLVTGLPPIKKVVAKSRHTVALTDSGEVWVTGFNIRGALGLGHTKIQTSFTPVPNLTDTIIDVACGANHTALLSASQVLFVAGWNSNGQLGLAGAESVSIFARVSVPTASVAAVSCGYYHTLALTVDGSVWSWGDNGAGQLGIGKADCYEISIPTKVTGLENHIISQVIAGCYHSAMLTEDGEVLMCGDGECGELGRGRENLFVPTLLPKSPGLVVKQVAFSLNYSLLLIEPKCNTAPTPGPQCVAATVKKDKEPPGSITDWERTIMRSLECPVCLKIMTAPIHLCANGHSLCHACRSHAKITVCPLCQQRFGQSRNISLECLSMEIELPCVDCLKRMQPCELEKHEEVCPNRN